MTNFRATVSNISNMTLAQRLLEVIPRPQLIGILEELTKLAADSKTPAEKPAASAAAAGKSPKRFLSRKQQAERWGTCTKTVERWGDDPEMGLPPEYWFGRSRCGTSPKSRSGNAPGSASAHLAA
jgi:hypothetical protein